MPWSIGLFVLATAQWLRVRRSARAAATPVVSAGPGPSGGAGPSGDTLVLTRVPSAVTAVLAVQSSVVALGAVRMVYRIGDSGAQAVWQGIA